MAVSTRIRLEVIPLSLSPACMMQKKNWLREILRARSMQQVFPHACLQSQLTDLAKDGPLIVYTQMQAAEDK